MPTVNAQSAGLSTRRLYAPSDRPDPPKVDPIENPYQRSSTMLPPSVPDKALTARQLAYVSRKMWRRFPDDTPEKHARHCELEIEDRRRRGPFNKGREIIKELDRFIKNQFCAPSLPDDDWGREILWEVLNQHALQGADRRKLVRKALDLLPEIDDADLEVMLEEIGNGAKRSGIAIAQAIGLDFATRDLLNIRIIGCTNKDKTERKAIYALLAACNKQRKRDLAMAASQVSSKRQRSRGGRPSLGNPWLALGISRRTWFRRQKVALNPVALNLRRHKKSNKNNAIAEPSRKRASGQRPPSPSASGARSTAGDRPQQGNLTARRAPPSTSAARWQPVVPLPVPIRAGFAIAFDPRHPPTWVIAVRDLLSRRLAA
jgi:hypothetical protein